MPSNWSTPLVARQMENVMFNYKHVIDSVKALAFNCKTDNKLSHCQLLDFQAKRLGFQSYHHLRETLRHLPQDSFAGLSIGLMRRICEMRVPRARSNAYFEFLPLPNGVGYYSYWIGWDTNGEEVRVPRPLDGRSAVNRLREIVNYPIYVIESDSELAAWQHVWKSTAYIPEELARKHFPKCFNKRHLIADPPPSDKLIKAAGNRRTQNFETDPSSAI